VGTLHQLKQVHFDLDCSVIISSKPFFLRYLEEIFKIHFKRPTYHRKEDNSKNKSDIQKMHNPLWYGLVTKNIFLSETQ